MGGSEMKVCGRRLYQSALLVIIAALVASCGLLWGGPVSEIRGSGNLDLILWVSRSLPSIGQPVKVRFTVENTGNQIEVIQLEEKPVMDIQIHIAAGGDITKLYWSDGREITPERRRLELAPGESKTIEMTWVVKACGSVRVSGILHQEHGYQEVPVHICVGSCGIH